MSSAFRSRNIIYKSVAVLIVGIIVLHCNFNRYIVDDSLTVNNLLVKRSRTAVQILNKFFDSTFVVESLLNRLLWSFIAKNDFQSLCQKCHLTESLL